MASQIIIWQREVNTQINYNESKDRYRQDLGTQYRLALQYLPSGMLVLVSSISILRLGWPIDWGKIEII